MRASEASSRAPTYFREGTNSPSLSLSLTFRSERRVSRKIYAISRQRKEPLLTYSSSTYSSRGTRDPYCRSRERALRRHILVSFLQRSRNLCALISRDARGQVPSPPLFLSVLFVLSFSLAVVAPSPPAKFYIASFTSHCVRRKISHRASATRVQDSASLDHDGKDSV